MLIDGTQKKIRFVNEAIEALGIPNAKAVAVRAEDLDEPKYDAVDRARGRQSRRRST